MKAGTPTEALNHAGYYNKIISQQNSLQLGKRSKIESDFWYVDHFKLIPSLMSDYLEGNSDQAEQNLRMALNFTTSASAWYVKYRTGLFYDNILYSKKKQSGTETSLNQCYSFINEAEGKYSWSNRSKLFLGINNTYEKAVTDNYVADTSRNRISIFGRYYLSLFSGLLDISAEARQEFVESKAIPFIGSLGIRSGLGKGFTIKATLAKHYSLPDMNDIFWKEDAFAKGNPNLKPEYGWNYELGVAHAFKSGSIEFQHEITGFQSSVYDLIVWLPGSDSKWEPLNLNHSVSRGLEFSGKTSIQLQSSFITMYYNYSYIHSIVYNKGSEEERNHEENRTYIPKNKASVSLNWQYRKMNLSYTQLYVSKRMTDVSHYLKAYTLGEFSINYLLKTSFATFSPYIKVRNVLNTSYQIMNGYAQPPRSYYAGLNISF
jgi:iron complex outermembrane receptor protein